MPTPEKRWDWMAHQISFHQEKARGALELFIKIATAVVGGTAWLSTQHPDTVLSHRFALLGDGLLGLSAVLSAFVIFEHQRAWRGWRGAQSKLAGRDPVTNEWLVPLPKLRSTLVEASMAATCLGFAGVFALLNPLSWGDRAAPNVTHLQSSAPLGISISAQHDPR